MDVFDESIPDSVMNNEESLCSDEIVLHDNSIQANSVNEAVKEPNLTQEKSDFVVPSPRDQLKPKTKCFKIRLAEEDPRIQEAFDFLKSPIQTHSPSLIYAQYIANKLDTYQGQTRALVEHAIHNVFFEADMGKFNHYSSSHSISSNSPYYSQKSQIPQYSMPTYPITLVTEHQTTPAPPYINVTSPASVSSDRSFTDSSTVPETSHSNYQELFNEFSN